jgi:hypothetical protein
VAATFETASTYVFAGRLIRNAEVRTHYLTFKESETRIRVLDCQSVFEYTPGVVTHRLALDEIRSK